MRNAVDQSRIYRGYMRMAMWWLMGSGLFTLLGAYLHIYYPSNQLYVGLIFIKGTPLFPKIAPDQWTLYSAIVCFVTLTLLGIWLSRRSLLSAILSFMVLLADSILMTEQIMRHPQDLYIIANGAFHLLSFAIVLRAALSLKPLKECEQLAEEQAMAEEAKKFGQKISIFEQEESEQA